MYAISSIQFDFQAVGSTLSFISDNWPSIRLNAQLDVKCCRDMLHIARHIRSSFSLSLFPDLGNYSYIRVRFARLIISFSRNISMEIFSD